MDFQPKGDLPKVDLDKVKESIKKRGKIAGEFKEFISRGNVVDMAVGIIVGSAFTKIVNSLVQDIITPIIGYMIRGINFTEIMYTFPDTVGTDAEVSIRYGAFARAIIDFLLISLVVFLMVKLINRIRRKKEDPPAPPPEPKVSDEAVLLAEIRDLLKDK